VPRLALWNVDDAQRFVCSIVSRSGLALSWSDREDLEQYLLVECWRLSLRYQPGGPKDFDGWASRILKVRVVDWQRQRNGRTRWAFHDSVYKRERPQFVSLDDPDVDRMGEAVSGSSLDDGSCGLAAELRALQTRGRRPGGRDDGLDREAA
jgi:DNA-directed RNA polymerase specialized sigma24 family protein